MKLSYRVSSIAIFLCAQLCFAEQVDLSKPLSTSEAVGSIPRDDSPNSKEVENFEKNWKGRTISFTGKVNRGGGVSINEFYIVGCAAAVKNLRPGELITVTGTLVSRYSGGSGGEPVELANCRRSNSVSTRTGSVSSISSIPPQFHGFWDVRQQNCKKLEDTETAITIKSNSTYQLELGCKLKTIDKLTEQSVTANMLCESAGERVKHVYTFELLPDGRLALGNSRLVRCK